MSTNCRVELPISARTRRLEVLIARIMGTPVSCKPLQNNGTIDPSRPASPSNDWYMSVSSKDTWFRVEEKPFDLSFGILMVHAGHATISWPISMENEQERPGVTLLPDATPLHIAVSSRLVHFFGGRMQPNDSVDRFIEVSPEHAKFGPMGNASSDQRWYQFHNAVRNEPVLTPREIQIARELSAYPDHRESLKLEERLPSLAVASLEQMVDPHPGRPGTNRSRRI